MLRENARKEFEEARYETDPEIINRLLVTGRDCVHQVRNKVRVDVWRIALVHMYVVSRAVFGAAAADH